MGAKTRINAWKRAPVSFLGGIPLQQFAFFYPFEADMTIKNIKTRVSKNLLKTDTYETCRPHVGHPRFLAKVLGKKHSPSPGGGWLAGWVGGWLVGWLAGLAGLAGWLAGLAKWLAGWLVTLRLVWLIGFDTHCIRMKSETLRNSVIGRCNI